MRASAMTQFRLKTNEGTFKAKLMGPRLKEGEQEVFYIGVLILTTFLYLLMLNLWLRNEGVVAVLVM